jgi:hypothetical protein
LQLTSDNCTVDPFYDGIGGPENGMVGVATAIFNGSATDQPSRSTAESYSGPWS